MRNLIALVALSLLISGCDKAKDVVASVAPISMPKHSDATGKMVIDPWAGDFGDGVAAYNKKNYAVAIVKFRSAAAQGNAKAQFYLGDIYRDGEGVVPDDAEAVKWYKLSAAQGHASAQLDLGNMYTKGHGVVEDFAEAMKWYKLAAEQGHAGALSNLALMYEYGQGVDQDYVRSHRWMH